MRTTTAAGLTAAVLALASAACAPTGGHTITTPAVTATTTTSCVGLPSECGGQAKWTFTPTATTEETPLPAPKDFQLSVIEMSHTCFGSAGCIVEYRVTPLYAGPLPHVPDGDFTLLYELDGADEMIRGNIAVHNGKYNPDEGMANTDGGMLSAYVTQVLED